VHWLGCCWWLLSAISWLPVAPNWRLISSTSPRPFLQPTTMHGLLSQHLHAALPCNLMLHTAAILLLPTARPDSSVGCSIYASLSPRPATSCVSCVSCKARVTTQGSHNIKQFVCCTDRTAIRRSYHSTVSLFFLKFITP
jgi:hypothetical protein